MYTILITVCGEFLEGYRPSYRNECFLIVA